MLRLLLLLLLLLLRFLLHTPLNPNQLSVRSLFHPSLLETLSLQGSMVNSLRGWGCEPLRSASRLLGSFSPLYLGCGAYPRTASLSGSPFLVAPDSLTGRLMLVGFQQGPDALSLIPAAFAIDQHRRASAKSHFPLQLYCLFGFTARICKVESSRKFIKLYVFGLIWPYVGLLCQNFIEFGSV